MRRPGPPREIPPPLELECLKALWSIGEGNVRDVRQALSSNRDLAYTTVMTVLDRLVHRGNVARRKVGRSFVYAPILTRDAVRRLALRELIDSFFNASENELLTYLGTHPQPPRELRSVPSEDTLDTTLL
jgi:predicted transcriptional regulator